MAFGDVFKALLLPFLIAALTYALFAYLLIPLYRKHHARYANYLPLQTLSDQTSSLRSRLQRSLLPSFMRWRLDMHDNRYDISSTRYTRGDSESDEELFGAEEGEVMVGFDFNRGRGRLPVRDEGGRVVGEEDPFDSRGSRGEGEIDSNRRLSRELEEGFKDESEDEEGAVDDRRR